MRVRFLSGTPDEDAGLGCVFPRSAFAYNEAAKIIKLFSVDSYSAADDEG